MKTTRFDCLKSVNVSDLEVVAVVHVEFGILGTICEREAWNQDLASKAEFPAFEGRCDCCGSTRLQCVCEVVHKPTSTGYYIGRTCAYKIDGLAGMVGVERMSVALAEKARQRSARAKWVELNPQHAAIIDWAGSAAHHIATDVFNKLGRYGSISEGQAALLYRIKQQVAEREAAKAAEPKPTAPAPEGRVEVELEVLGEKKQEGFRPGETVIKLLCRVLSTGAKVWMSKPADLRAERGERFKVRATFTRSDKDQFFSFGSRPKLVDYAGYVPPVVA